MNHEISKDRNRLTIKVTPEEQQELREIEQCGGDCQCDCSMTDYLSPLVCNSELDWVFPEETGDLTDAPMMGVRTPDDPHAITERWAFMDYQVRSVLEDLRDKGEAVFVGGAL